MNAGSAPEKPGREGILRQLVGRSTGGPGERYGYWFWGSVAVFVGVPDILAGLSKTLKAQIPWPTISNLVGKDLEAHHHWIALVVVGSIAIVAAHALTYPAERKLDGRVLGVRAGEVIELPWSGRYIVAVGLAGAGAGLLAGALGASKNELGYAIYVTLAVLGVLVPSALAYRWNRVLAVPTLFATIALLRARAPWVALLVLALLVVHAFPPRALPVAELSLRLPLTARRPASLSSNSVARYVTTIDSSLTPEEAFAYMADFSNAREWDPSVTEASRSHADVGLGSTSSWSSASAVARSHCVMSSYCSTLLAR